MVVTTTGQTTGLRATLVPVDIYSEDEGLAFLAERTNLPDKRLGESVPLFEATLADRVRVLGEEHPDTRVLRDNLAAARQAAEQVGRKKKRLWRGRE